MKTFRELNIGDTIFYWDKFNGVVLETTVYSISPHTDSVNILVTTGNRNYSLIIPYSHANCTTCGLKTTDRRYLPYIIGKTNLIDNFRYINNRRTKYKSSYEIYKKFIEEQTEKFRTR